MLQELTGNTGAGLIAIGSTLFFIIIFTGVAVRVLTRKAGSYDDDARLPLEDAASAGTDERCGSRDESTTGGC